MNAIKNTIVSVTLLAVAFGAYTVLQNPPEHSLGENELTWDATSDLMDPDIPEASLPVTETLATNSSNSQQKFFDQIGAPRSENPPANFSDETAPSDIVSPETNTVPDESTHQYADQSYADSEYIDENVPSDGAAETVPASSQTSFDTGAETAIESIPNGGYYDQVAGDESQLPGDDSAVEIPPSSGLNGNETDSSPVDEFETKMNYVQVQLEQGQLGEALLVLSQSYESGLPADRVKQVSNLMDQLAGTVIYSSESYIQPVHQVQTDESLDSIAAKYQLPINFLARVNGLSVDYQPVIGESLKVLQGPFRAVINATTGELTVYLGEYYAGRFYVQFGDDVPRSTGEFEVIEKSDGREFFDRSSGYRIAKDDPANPYGHRWIGLRGKQVTAGHNVGIHVANENAPNAGCFRVSPVDADDLTAILSIGSRITYLR